MVSPIVNPPPPSFFSKWHINISCSHSRTNINTNTNTLTLALNQSDMRTTARRDLDVERGMVVRERIDLEFVDGQGRLSLVTGLGCLAGGFLVEGETVQQAREGDEHVAHG